MDNLNNQNNIINLNTTTQAENTENSFDSTSIFNRINFKSYLDDLIDIKNETDNNINNTNNTNNINNQAFLCGKMNEHSIQAKYDFKACEFYIYIPSKRTIFYSEMQSEDCFTNSLKWNYNFFKKLRLCLQTSDNIKNTYFSFNYLDEKDKGICSSPDTDDFIIPERQICFELHFVVDTQDITAFKLILKPLIDDNPYQTILNHALELDKIETDKLSNKQIKLYEREMETERMNNEIKLAEDGLAERKKEYMSKFYYLNKEKNKKIAELSNEIKKERKLIVK